MSKALAKELAENVPIKGKSLAVVSLRDRTGTQGGKAVAEELGDKLSGDLAKTGWFDVKERIDLRVVLDEKDLDTAGIIKNEAVRSKLAGVQYIVIGGVTVSESK